MHEVRRTVRREHGGEYLSRAPRAYRSRAVNVDVAHEAIRPIPVARTPESLAGAVGPDEVRLYALIRDRMLASQMAEARLGEAGGGIPQQVDYGYNDKQLRASPTSPQARQQQQEDRSNRILAA